MRLPIIAAMAGNTGAATPTLSSAAINSAGTTVTLTFSASVSIGAGGNGGVTLAVTNGAEGTSSSGAGSGTGTAVTATYASGAPGTALVYNLSRTFNKTAVETCTVSYTQPGNGIEATSGGADVASFGPSAVTNNSTAQTYTQAHARITPVGGIQGIGYDGTFNAAVQARARMSRLRNTLLGYAFVPTRIGLSGYRSGSPANQEIFAIIYQPTSPSTAAGEPDDRLGSVVGGKYSNDFPASSPAAQVTWDFTGVGAIADDDYYNVGAYVGSLFTNPNYVGFEYVSSGNLGVDVRNNDTTPATPNDAANWTNYDANDQLDTQVWCSP